MGLIGKGWVRRSLLLVVVLAGLGLLVAGAILEQASIGVLGLGAWLILVIAITFGMRARVSHLAESLSGTRRDIGVLRESQLKMHSRVAGLKATVISSSSVAVEGMARLDRGLGEQVQLLHEQRRMVEDGHSLVLRVFRESDTVWQGVGERIDESERSAEEVSKNLRLSLQDQIASINQLEARLKELVAHTLPLEQIGSSNERIESIVGEVRTGIDGAKAAFDQLASNVEKRLQKTGADVDVQLSKLIRQTGPVVEIAASGKELRSALTGMEARAEGILDEVQQHRKSSKREINRIKYETVQEVEALMHLQKLVQLAGPTPLLGGWAMDPAATLRLVQMVLEQRPKLILECGSGASTVWLAAALKQASGGKLISLDHLDVYAQSTRRALEQQELQGIAEVRLAELEEVEIDGEMYSWYSKKALTGIEGIELLSIDGPPSAVGKLARFPAVPMLAAQLANRAVIVLDDADRADEKAIIKRWRAQHREILDVTQLGSRTIACHWSAPVG